MNCKSCNTEINSKFCPECGQPKQLYDNNFYEIVRMLCFVMGMGMLIFSVLVVLQGLTHLNLMTFAGVAGVLYSAWAIGHFFEKRKIASYLKHLLHIFWL